MAPTLGLLLLCPFVFFTSLASAQNQVCGRPTLAADIEEEGLQRLYMPGEEVVLSCRRGYSPISGPRIIVCTSNGIWTSSKMKCIPKVCPTPDMISNGDVYYEDNIYLSTVNFSCNVGYTLHGAASIVCLDDGTWSAPTPECLAVTCSLAPIPQFGMITYDTKITGNTTHFGLGGTYKCLPPLALIGNGRGHCTASGEWTEPPVCQLVACPPPQPMENGYMSSTQQRLYDYKETITYGCNGDYVIDGSIHIVCQDTGEWSEKPVCQAPCMVDIKRGRIFYNNRKLWINELNRNIVFHGDIVSFYCLDKARKCGYAVPTQCINGKLKIPECFEEPSAINYGLYSSSLPSEIQQC